jgi:large subunit ribosomal protein L4
MLEVKSLQAGGAIGSAKLDATAFERRENPVVLREAVLMYEARRRVGTACTKTRSQINGSTKKIYRQKGTGRARHGDRKAPSFRGGGVAHGPKPRDYSYSLPRKALVKALRIALSGKIRDSEVLRWEGSPISGDAPSTKVLRQGLDALGATGSALIVSAGQVDKALLLSVRNLPKVRVLPAAEVSAYDAVRYHWLVLLDGAYEVLRSRLGIDEAPAQAEEGSAS